MQLPCRHTVPVPQNERMHHRQLEHSVQEATCVCFFLVSPCMVSRRSCYHFRMTIAERERGRARSALLEKR